jgi:hypothetical protein
MQTCEHHLLFFLHTLDFLRSSVWYRKKNPTVPRTTTAMAALCIDHEFIQPWVLVTTSPDDYRMDLTKLLQPTTDNGNWDPTASYAQLLYQALKNAPDKTLNLCDIYEWFRHNTDKGDKSGKSSIRYNLSMNAARLLPSLPSRH